MVVLSGGGMAAQYDFMTVFKVVDYIRRYLPFKLSGSGQPLA
jgi:hypothetical protein